MASFPGGDSDGSVENRLQELKTGGRGAGKAPPTLGMSLDDGAKSSRT